MRAMQPQPPTHQLRSQTRIENTYTQKSVGKTSTDRGHLPPESPTGRRAADGPGRGAYPLDIRINS
jgi:hypothetical protein